MAVRIRLKRMGAKKRPFYRLIIANSRAPRNGRFIDTVGYYQPLSQPVEIKVDEEKIIQWLKKGAQPTSAVKSLFKKIGLNDKLKALEITAGLKEEITVQPDVLSDESFIPGDTDKSE